MEMVPIASALHLEPAHPSLRSKLLGQPVAQPDGGIGLAVLQPAVPAGQDVLAELRASGDADRPVRVDLIAFREFGEQRASSRPPQSVAERVRGSRTNARISARILGELMHAAGRRSASPEQIRVLFDRIMHVALGQRLFRRERIPALRGQVIAAASRQCVEATQIRRACYNGAYKKALNLIPHAFASSALSMGTVFAARGIIRRPKMPGPQVNADVNPLPVLGTMFLGSATVACLRSSVLLVCRAINEWNEARAAAAKVVVCERIADALRQPAENV